MARHEIDITPSAERQLRRLSRSDRQRVARTMLALAEEPFPWGARKLSGYDDVYRVRARRYRILYSVSESSNSHYGEGRARGRAGGGLKEALGRFAVCA